MSAAIKLANQYGVSLSVRGGGHSYTCQGTRTGSLMIDTRYLDNIQVNYNPRNATNTTYIQPHMTVGTGLTWGAVLDKLALIRENSKVDLITVHGQCTSVGVAGFSLHGGMHFGGLSSLYGLGSDNVLGLTAVVANGSIVELSDEICTVDGVALDPDSASCHSLWTAIRQAGSSYGIVTSMNIKLHPRPIVHTALSILSMDTADPVHAQEVISAYFTQLPVNVTVTFFGLDAYFKAYFFLLKFSSDKYAAAMNDARYLIDSSMSSSSSMSSISSSSSGSGRNMIHFIVEASWIDSNTTTANTDINADVNDMFNILQQCHTTTQQSVSVEKAVFRPWIKSTGYWAVSSYDLVWGKGHSYGGATMTTSQVYEKEVLIATFERYNMYKNSSNQVCSDSVTVIHRISESLRQRVSTQYSNSLSQEDDASTSSFSTSFHRSLSRGSLWVEIDYGHFYRHRASWPQCSASIDHTQRALDSAVPLSHRAHYPNVPNLVADQWTAQYYGLSEDHYGSDKMDEKEEEKEESVFVTAKRIWDPNNIFSHYQSIPLGKGHNYEGSYDTLSRDRVNEQGKACRAVYDSVIYDSNMFIVKCMCSVFVLILGIVYVYFYMI